MGVARIRKGPRHDPFLGMKIKESVGTQFPRASGDKNGRGRSEGANPLRPRPQRPGALQS